MQIGCQHSTMHPFVMELFGKHGWTFINCLAVAMAWVAAYCSCHSPHCYVKWVCRPNIIVNTVYQIDDRVVATSNYGGQSRSPSILPHHQPSPLYTWQEVYQKVLSLSLLTCSGAGSGSGPGKMHREALHGHSPQHNDNNNNSDNDPLKISW